MCISANSELECINVKTELTRLYVYCLMKQQRWSRVAQRRDIKLDITVTLGPNKTAALAKNQVKRRLRHLAAQAAVSLA